MDGRRLVISLLALAAVTLLAASCPQGQQGQEEGGGGFSGPPPVAVLLEPVQMIEYAPAIELVGEVRASQKTMLTAEVAGKVTAISHRVGESHKSSDGALIRIDAASYQAALDGANAALRQAQERANLARKGPRQQEIAAQQARVASAVSQYEQALDNLERQRQLFEEDVTPESAVVAAEKQAESLKAAVEAQQQVLNSLLEGSRQEDIDSAEAAVAAAQSNVQAAQLALSRTSITVPFDAVVSDLMVEVGAFVGPGTPVAEVVSSAACEAWFNLPEEEFSQIHPGDAVEVTFDALPDVKISGEVISLSPSANGSARQFPVRVSLNDDRPKAGMAAYGRLETELPEQVLAVSRDATVLSNLGVVVWVMVPPAPDAQPPMPGMDPLPTVNQVLVETGDTYNDLVIIKGDLEPGALVVSRGNENLMMGSMIIPVNMAELMAAMGGGAPPGGSAPPEAAPAGDAGAGQMEEPAADGESHD